ncbi:MAG: penicillin-binding protein 2 [Promethearchaeota archaeon Loki_b32]|nr:MAG: penicillin-binding protein 2 [Candidatus Lokiarchaeota archaeon Loki_b32]
MFGRFKRRIKFKQRRDIEPHEIILDKLAREKEEEWGVSIKRVNVPLLEKTLTGFLVVLFLIMLVLFFKTFQLQVLEGESYLAQAVENKFIIQSIEAERGVIYDKNLKQLVFNIPQFDLIYDKESLEQSKEEEDKVLKEVARILEKDYEGLRNEIASSTDSLVYVSVNLEREKLIILQTKINELTGFEIRKTSTRDYEDGEVFAHLMGYMGKIKRKELEGSPEFYSILDYVGRDGLENYYEDILRKSPGKVKIERDALGNILSQETEALPESGKSLVLWLDSDLQKKVKEVLENKLYEVGSKKGVVIALDPKTGGILSLVSLPSFDNNVFSKGESSSIEKILNDENKPLFNRVISGRYVTGSTIKPLIALAGLEEKIISPGKYINCHGSIIVEDLWTPEVVWEYKDLRAHGYTDMRKALAESCNVYFYRLGGGYKEQDGLGPTRIKKYLQMFGWQDKTGIDIPGEVNGFIPDKEWKKRVLGQGWWDGDTYHLSIGQGYLQITPIEVVTSFLPIANNGKMFKPQVVKKIINSETAELIEEIEPEIIKEDFIDIENIQVVREGMRQAVTGYNSPHASAMFLSSLPVSAAVKTGTAETPREDLYHNWATVFAPYDDPEILITIMIEDVEGVRAATLPVAYEVLNWYFSR